MLAIDEAAGGDPVIRFKGAGGRAIAADVAGDVDGLAVLFLHGAGQTRQSWQTPLRTLARNGYLTISLDARGHGDSDWTSDGYTVDQLAADLRTVISRLDRRVAIIGASMGGLTALAALDQDPDLPLTALTLVDVVPRPNPEGVAHIMAFMRANPHGFASLQEAAEVVSRFLPHRTRPPTPEGLSKNLRKRGDGRYYWHWDPAFLDSRVDDFKVSDRYERLLGRLTIPTMLVRGRESDVVTDAELEHFRKLAPAARIADIQGAAHMVAGDKNDVFFNVISDFLRHSTGDVDGGGSADAAGIPAGRSATPNDGVVPTEPLQERTS